MGWPGHFLLEILEEATSAIQLQLTSLTEMCLLAANWPKQIT
jgi:hypothetical protein